MHISGFCPLECKLWCIKCNARGLEACLHAMLVCLVLILAIHDLHLTILVEGAIDVLAALHAAMSGSYLKPLFLRHHCRGISPTLMHVGR